MLENNRSHVKLYIGAENIEIEVSNSDLTTIVCRIKYLCSFPFWGDI